jgi:transcriptional regulator with XRE-family HTH domain
MDARERSPWATAVAVTIRAERAARNWSQDDLVMKAGIPKSTVRRLESGERVADVTQVSRVSRAFGLTMTEFFRRAESRLSDLEGQE